MKKRFISILISLFAFCLSACSSNNVSSQGFTVHSRSLGVKIVAPKNSAINKIPIAMFYGHNLKTLTQEGVDDYAKYQYVINLTASYYNEITKKREYFSKFSQEIDDFIYDESNAMKISGQFIFSQTQFSKSIEKEIDFSDITNDKGELKCSLKMNTVKGDNYQTIFATIYYQIKGNKVYFSK